MTTLIAAVAPDGSATSRSARLGSLAMTGALLLTCTTGLVTTSIQALTHAPTTATVPIGR